MKPGFIVPTGNLGHGFAALYARAMGFPLGPVVLATNANPALTQYLSTGQWEPSPSLSTLASAMDVAKKPAASHGTEDCHINEPTGKETVKEADREKGVGGFLLQGLPQGGLDTADKSGKPHRF